MTAVAAVDTDERLCGQSSDGEFVAWQWHRRWNCVLNNKNGSIGWARIIQSTKTDLPPGHICRINLCANDPCTAMWLPGKDGHFLVPTHLRAVPEPAVFSAVAAPLAAEPAIVEPAAVAEPPPVVEPTSQLPQELMASRKKKFPSTTISTIKSVER